MTPISSTGMNIVTVGSIFTNNKQRNKPKKANLTKTPLKKIEKLVDASTWALGNQP